MYVVVVLKLSTLKAKSITCTASMNYDTPHIHNIAE